jgi:soluble lytic murein transglycosylase-like protein
MKRSNKYQALFCVMCACACCAAPAADVYRAANPDGSFRYASQALDSSYVLYLPGESVSEVVSPLKRKTARTARRTALEPLIDRLANKHAVDAALVRALIDVESGFDQSAVSPKGAAGLMQLMPATAARYGASQRDDPAQNIEAGVRYLKDLLTLHDGNVALALASYNAGEGAVARHGKRIPPYKETMLYVPAVLMRLHSARETTSP